MKSKTVFKFGSLKDTDPSIYIHHEKIDISNKFPTLSKVIENSDVKLFDIPQLQIETEKIMSNLGYRILHLKSLIDGNPIKKINGQIYDNSRSSQYLQIVPLPTEDSLTHKEFKEEPSSSNESLVVKSVPEKPMTLIIAQNRSSTSRASHSPIMKRKTSKEVTKTVSKKQKLSLTDHATDKDIKPNYEIPNKFWELMEPYCAEINDEHISTLENYIQNYENDSKFYELPDVSDGANDRSLENKATKTTFQRRHPPTVEENSLNGFVDNKSGVELSNLLKKIDSEIRYISRKPLSQTKSLKSFPQNLVNKMSQETEQLIAAHKSNITDSKNGISSEASGLSKTLAKQLKVSNSYKIERHVKKSMDELGMCNFNLPFVPQMEPQFDLCTESEQHGIAKSSEADIIDPSLLDCTDFVTLHLPKTDANLREDKALLGLLRRQAELRLVSESNLGMLRRLLVTARRDMRRQEVERRLAVADADVVDSYNVIESYRPARKPPLKKDRDAAYKALKERQRILKELESFDSEFM